MAHSTFGERCILFLDRYLENSVGGVRDYVSLGFGFICVFNWPVTEIPHISTNFMSGSTEGFSLALIMTWVVG